MDLKQIGFPKITRALFFKMAFVACVVVAASFMQVDRSCAQGAQPKTPCDPEYMDALEARAWLEAQREITQNQNLIFRPESVLELSCFDKFLDEAASNFAQHRQFSETDRWDRHPQHFSNTTTDDALTFVVLQPFNEYFRSNFSPDQQYGDYLNNRTQGQNHRPSQRVSGGDYGCAEMQKVWQLARCMQFNPEAENRFDGFFDFQYYESTDPRTESNTWNLMCQTPDSRIATARQAAFNQDQELFDVGPDNDTGSEAAEGNGTPYREDDIVTHLDKVLPGSCNHCVRTGIQVQRPDMGQFDEQVCTNPGCPAPGGGGGGGGGTTP